MTAALYVNPQGYNVTRHSYSGSQTFNACARKYQLERIGGWGEKSQSAAMKFGIEVEAAVTEFHRAGLDAAIEKFITGWGQHADNRELEYGKKQISWNNLLEVGQQMIRLYAIKYPTFPYVIPNSGQMTQEQVKACFQVNHNVEVFPGTDLAGIELTSYLDVVAKLKSGKTDPMVPSELGIFDCKVSAASCPFMVEMDPQLRTYAWVTGIPVVGFLWFEICSQSLGVGDEVTLLDDIDWNGYPVAQAGKKVYFLSDDFNTIPLSPKSVYLTDKIEVIEGLKAIKGQKNADKAARLDYIGKNGVDVPVTAFTTQSVEVRLATISKSSQVDIQKQVEQDIVRIVHASETEFFPMQSGVRFPHNQCNDCCMRGICTGNDKLRDELVQRDLKKGKVAAF